MESIPRNPSDSGSPWNPIDAREPFDDDDEVVRTEEESQKTGSSILAISDKLRASGEGESDDAESQEAGEDKEALTYGKIREEVEKFVTSKVSTDYHEYSAAMSNDDLCSFAYDALSKLGDLIKTHEELMERLEKIVSCAMRARRIFDVAKAIAFSRLDDFDSKAAEEKAMEGYDSMMEGGRDPLSRPFGGVSDWMEFRRRANVPDRYESDAIPIYHPDPDFHGVKVSVPAERPVSSYYPDMFEGGYRLSAFETSYHPSRLSIFENNYRPSAFEGNYRPSAFERSYRPSFFESDYRPSVFESNYRPSFFESNYRPSAFESGYRPSPDYPFPRLRGLEGYYIA